VDNAAHLHLLVNHFPIIGAFLSIPLLVLTLLLRKERGLLLASVFLLVVVAGTAWASLATGDKAHDMIEAQENSKAYATMDEADVPEHERRADLATWWFAVPTAAAGLVVLVMARRRAAENPLPRWCVAVLLVGAALTSWKMAMCGNAGGVIMHREIRGDSMDTTSKDDPKAKDDKVKEKDDK
jgi:hypothetical protein